MSTRRSSARKRAASHAQKSYPPDAFYAPLFKNRVKKLLKFLKWINALSTDNMTQILLTINETISNDLIATRQSDKLSKKLEIIVLADIIQTGYRCYGLYQDCDKKYEKELKLLGIKNIDVIKMIIKLIKKIYKNRTLIKSSSSSSSSISDVSYPHFQSLRWRLDVTISNSNLKRVLKPSLVLSFTLSDGRIKYMESSINKFHELRFNVSRVLRELQVIQQRLTDNSMNNNNIQRPNYVVKYKKLAQIAGLNKLTQIQQQQQQLNDNDVDNKDNQ